MELNRMMHFTGVTEGNFHSIFRRALVICIHGRFVDCSYYDAHMPHGHLSGVFPRDNDLRDFLRSGPAIAAGLRMQHAFEMGNSREKCAKLISDYTYHGGDGGATLKHLREACGLPPAQSEGTERDGDARRAALPLGVDLLAPTGPAVSQAAPADGEPEMRETVIRHMLQNRMDVMTSVYFRSVQLPRRAGKNKNESWALIVDSSAWMREFSRPKGGGGGYLPVLKTRVPCNVVLGQVEETKGGTVAETHAVSLPESYDVEGFRTYLLGKDHRQVNIEIMIDVLRGCRSRRRNPGRRPKQSSVTLVDVFEELADSLADAEKGMTKILQMMDGGHSPTSPQQKRRRMSQKVGSAEMSQKLSSTEVVGAPNSTGSDGSAAAGPAEQLRQVRVTYKYKSQRGRLFVDGVASQGLPRRALKVLLPHTVDLDVENAAWCLVSQIVEKLHLEDSHLFTEEFSTLLRVATDRQGTIQSELKCDLPTGKHLLLKILGGASQPPSWSAVPFLDRVQRLARVLRWLACSNLPDVYQSRMEENARWPEASTFSIFWQRAEDLVLRSWLAAVCDDAVSHLSLHFDGLRLDQASVMRLGGPEQCCRHAEEAIKRSTGFCVKIAVKHHLTLSELLRQEAYQSRPLPKDAAVLGKEGNCILCALWSHKTELQVDPLQLALQQSAVNEAAMKKGARTYGECFENLNLRAMAHVGFDPKHSGVYLIHAENTGRPHCISAFVNVSAGEVRIFDTGLYWDLSLAKLCCHVRACVDSKTIVSFHVGRLDQDLPNPYAGEAGISDMNGLRDLHAGARRDVEGVTDPYSLTVDDMPDTDVQIEETHVRREFADALRHEVSTYIDRVQQRCGSSPVRANARGIRCELCPFRRCSTHAALVAHVRSDHIPETHYVASGGKQWNIAQAIFDDMRVRRVSGNDVLRQSAVILRDSVKPPLSSFLQSIDRFIVLVLRATGPIYANSADLDRLQTRRVGNMYYTKDFADVLLQEALIHHGRVRSMIPAILRRLSDRGAKLSSLLPVTVVHWLRLLEDVMQGPTVAAQRSTLRTECLNQDEFSHVSMDATLRILRRVRGQADYRAHATERAEAAIADEDSKRRIFTVLGRTSCVLGTFVVRDEGKECVAQAFAQNWTAAERQAVRSCCSDQPSPALFQELKRVLPNLTIMALDPVHLAMTYEHSFFRKKSVGSRTLRCILAKFGKHSPTITDGFWGEVFDGSKSAPEWSRYEERRTPPLRNAFPIMPPCREIFWGHSASGLCKRMWFLRQKD